jgi:hypothetical protein
MSQVISVLLLISEPKKGTSKRTSIPRSTQTVDIESSKVKGQIFPGKSGEPGRTRPQAQLVSLHMAEVPAVAEPALDDKLIHKILSRLVGWNTSEGRYAWHAPRSWQQMEFMSYEWPVSWHRSRNEEGTHFRGVV